MIRAKISELIAALHTEKTGSFLKLSRTLKMLCNARMTPENPLMNLFSNLRGGGGYFQKTKILTL